MPPKTSNRKARYLVSSVALCLLSMYLMSSFLSMDFKIVELVFQNETYHVEKEFIKHRGAYPKMVRKRSTTTPKYVTTTPSSTSTPPTTTLLTTIISSTTTIPSTTTTATTTTTSSKTTKTNKPSTPTTVHQSSTTTPATTTMSSFTTTSTQKPSTPTRVHQSSTSANPSQTNSATTVRKTRTTIQSTSRSPATVSATTARVTTVHKLTTNALTATPTTTAKTVSSTRTVSTAESTTVITQAPKPTKSKITDKMVLSFKTRELSKKDHDILIDLVKVFIAVANAHNWTYFMYGGTTIGSIRHHGFIPWDDDIDFLINTTHVTELKEVFKKMEPKYTVHDRGNDPILKLFSSDSYICPRSHCKWKWPFVDLCFFTENSTHIWDTNKYFSHQKLRKADTFPVHLRPFEGLWIKAPKISLRMIQVIYGVSDVCKTHSYAHAKEVSGQKVYSITCKRLKDVYPFVFRRWVDGKMEETLRLGDEILDIQLVEHELPSTVTKPYSTLPINGF
ncbi:adhesion G-protein coupled receptor G4-like [Lineus longissimus]|uniref:adhesion G-protein coupled receptor G4-like n=1 Tax=Lineus longissimus TaxID=88925 RepID=UPI00315DB5C3